MTRRIEEAQPTWFRLSEESWAEIREAYRNGATAKELAIRWKVSPGSIYRHACEGGWTKKRSADARARAHAMAIAEEERADQTRPDEGMTASALFAGWDTPGDPETEDAAMLSRQAMAASVRAMRARMFAEAEKLAKLAESYGRMADRAAERAAASGPDGGRAPTIENLDLKLLFEIVFNADRRVTRRFEVRDDEDPDAEIKRAYWSRDHQVTSAFVSKWHEMLWRMHKAELIASGELPRPEPKPGPWDEAFPEALMRRAVLWAETEGRETVRPS